MKSAFLECLASSWVLKASTAEDVEVNYATVGTTVACDFVDVGANTIEGETPCKVRPSAHPPPPDGWGGPL